MEVILPCCYMEGYNLTKKVFNNLRMILESRGNEFTLDLAVSSGFAEYSVTIPLTEDDYSVIEHDEERAAFIQAAFHHPFQLKETWLSESEQREYTRFMECDQDNRNEKEHADDKERNCVFSRPERVTANSEKQRDRGEQK